MRTIGKYRIQGLLGRGGMGSVYRCVLPVAEKTVALKLLSPTEVMASMLGMEEIEALFLEEVRTLGRLRHSSLVDVLDFDRDAEGRPFYVMEYYCRDLGSLAGETYRAEDPTRILPVDRACRYLDGVLEGLAAMHRLGVIHRDLKPFNVMLAPDDRVKIIDFGLSRLRGERRGETPEAVRRSPRGFKIGTPFYAAPEQEADPDAADERSDLFSAGVLAWRLLTGRLPTEEGVAVPRPGVLNSQLGDDWDGFLYRAVDPDPGKRFGSAREMAGELRALCRKWAEDTAGTCAALPGAEAIPANGFPLRSEPVKVLPGQARSVFPVDELWRARRVSPGPFEDTGRGVILDHASGLCWEKGGADYPLDRREAEEYARHLADTGFGGGRGWRLPTVDELLSVMHPGPGPDGVCLDRLFNPGPVRLWSADLASFASAWYADVSLGFVAARDFSCTLQARCVCFANQARFVGFLSGYLYTLKWTMD